MEKDNSSVENNLLSLNSNYALTIQEYESKIIVLESKIASLEAEKNALAEESQISSRELNDKLRFNGYKMNTLEMANTQLRIQIVDQIGPRLKKKSREVEWLKHDMERNQLELIELSCENTQLKKELNNMACFRKAVNSMKSICLKNQQQALKLIESNLSLKRELEEVRKSKCVHDCQNETYDLTSNQAIERSKEEIKNLNLILNEYKETLTSLDRELNSNTRSSPVNKEVNFSKETQTEPMIVEEENTDSQDEQDDDFNDLNNSYRIKQLEAIIKDLNSDLRHKTSAIKAQMDKSSRLKVKLCELKSENERLKAR